MRKFRTMQHGPRISHDEALIRELRADPEFAAEYLAAARDDEEDSGVLLIAERRCLEAGVMVNRAKNL